MTKEQNREVSGMTPTDNTTGTQVKIRWDDANMHSNYSNFCNAMGTREEIVLLFGMNQAWHAGQKEVPIQLSDRIVLSPFVAKRLSLLLNNVIRDYETRYGALELEMRRTNEGQGQ